jgi:ubiquinone/menaquinone biosynthesis C-methylase UbiE
MPGSAPNAELAAFKASSRASWASGDYDAIAQGIWMVGPVVVERAGVEPGDRVLDIASGTGNAAVRAALAGGRVVGLDLTPELFPSARRRAAEAGVEVELVEGDAEALPFADASFDVVLSTFGVMFAPRHAVAAAEMTRVLRPGGRIGIVSWTPEGTVGGFFAIMGRHLPPLPSFAQPPVLWGTERHVREILDGTGMDLTFARERIPLKPDVELDESVDFYLRTFGPLLTARAYLEPDGRWEALEAELRPALTRMLEDPPEYLVVTGTKAI